MNERTCTVDGCEAPTKARGLCSKHYGRAARGSDLQDKPTHETCQAPGCQANPRSTHATYCEMHYGRQARNGNLYLARLPFRYHGPCANPECGRTMQTSLGYCKRCRERVRKHGNPNTVITDTRVAAPGYNASHQRVYRDRGPAKMHACVCGAPARHWAYDHTDPSELTSAYGPYSADPARYIPLCVPCHKRMDLAHLAGANP